MRAAAECSFSHCCCSSCVGFIGISNIFYEKIISAAEHASSRGASSNAASSVLLAAPRGRLLLRHGGDGFPNFFEANLVIIIRLNSLTLLFHVLVSHGFPSIVH
ncbi:hypothetical protein VPH35_079679 [Triticum aestivum]